MATATKTYTVIKHRKGRVTETEGTIEELIKYFNYTLESGHSYDSKVNLEPRTGKSLVTALNRATGATQGGSFDPNFYELKA